MALTLDLDGVLHTRGSSKCCKSVRVCRKCRGRLHTQGSYFGTLLACENCDTDWEETTPRDQLTSTVEEMLRDDSLSPQEILILIEDEAIRQGKEVRGPTYWEGELKKVMAGITEINKQMEPKVSNPFHAVVDKMRDEFETSKWERVAASFPLQPVEERKARLQVIIDLSSELVKIREATQVGTTIGESIIVGVIEGRWVDVAREADEDLVFVPGTVSDLWSWFRATAMTAAVQALGRTRGGSPSGGSN